MLEEQSIKDFSAALMSKSPVPGGGGVSALAGALAGRHGNESHDRQKEIHSGRANVKGKVTDAHRVSRCTFTLYAGGCRGV